MAVSIARLHGTELFTAGDENHEQVDRISSFHQLCLQPVPTITITRKPYNLQLRIIGLAAWLVHVPSAIE